MCSTAGTGATIPGAWPAWKTTGGPAARTACASLKPRRPSSNAFGRSEEYPRWGKAKLVVLLRREGIALSASTVGRVLQRLKIRGVLREPRRRRKATWHLRPHAQRLPKGYAVEAPGDLVQVDILDVEVLPGLRRKQFTARDMISRYDVVEAYSSATAHTGAAFLDLLQQRMPFPVRALQIDGGSEFQGAFEAACAARSLPLFVVPPHSPKLQSHVDAADAP